MEGNTSTQHSQSQHSQSHHDSSSSHNMTTPLPWAWIKAVNNILSNPPFEDPDEMPVQLTSWLYISDEAHSIRQIHKLMETQITHVLSMNLRPGEWQRTIQGRLTKCNIAHKAIGAKDEEGYDLIQHWENEAKLFLLQAKNHPNGKVVVHCTAGTNRSGFIAAAAMLLLDDENETSVLDESMPDGEPTPKQRCLLDVVKEIKWKRRMVLTNLSFQQQLCNLAALHGRLGDKPSGYSDEPARLKQQRQAGNFESMFL